MDTSRTLAGPTPPVGGVELTPRYAAVAVIGSGGLGQVLRAQDHRLGVAVALKVLHAHLLADPDWVRRFDAEARLLATLAHPGIPPVHDLDRLPDGRPFYTMALIDGERWGVAAPQLPLRRRMELLRDVAQTVGWAHGRGVVHRDLSPNNVLIERDGRARVIDWGLARRSGEADVPVLLSERAGTPGYSAPELHVGQASARTDVYAIGGLLGLGLVGEPEHRERHHNVAVDPDLLALWASCRRRRPEERPPDGEAVAAAIGAWLDGETRRERARLFVLQARERRALAEEAERRAAEVGRPAGGVADREDRWRAEDEATEAGLDAARRHAEAEQALHIALHEDPDCDAAHAALTRSWHERLLLADEAGDRLAVAELEIRLRGWRGGRHASLADSEGRLLLGTAPPAERVVVQRFVESGRRLVPVPVRVVDGPDVDLRLPSGSYRLVLERDGVQTLLPLRLPRGGTFTFAGRDGAPIPVPLAPPDLDVDACYMPGGWYRPVPDPGASESLEATPRWLEPFVLQRQPVTVGAWLAYLDDLAASEGLEAALARSPREVVSADQPRILARQRGGRFEIAGDEWSPTWPLDWPITLIDWEDATAYAAWRAARTGQPWRLPDEVEWEMAARGADGRIHAWGNHLEAGWACTALTVSGPPGRAPVTDFPIDESPYGLRGMTGNVREWCANVWSPPAGRAPSAELLRVVRGGSWSSAPPMCRLASRFVGRPGDRLTVIGVRLACAAGR